MLHTPPTRKNWKSDASVKGSYEVATSNRSPTEEIIVPKIRETNAPAKINKVEQKEVTESKVEVETNVESTEDYTLTESETVKEQLEEATEDQFTNEINLLLTDAFKPPHASDLPTDLLAQYELFLKELKEPKFDRSLAVCEISDLFRSFYQRFYKATIEFIDSDSQYELSEKNVPRSYQYYQYNLLIERLLCDTFYAQIAFPFKHLPIDDLEMKANEDFSSKLSYLNDLDIHFENLDIDLPKDIEKDFVNTLSDVILPEFELMTAERSPTLKMKYLIKVHKLLGNIIKNLTNNGGKDFVLNTDIYLPILIFTVIKLRDLRNHLLVTQLFLIKRFTNEHIFNYDDDQLQEERGKLLYVCANFEACISYLITVTPENLGFKPETVREKSPNGEIEDGQMGLLMASCIPLDVIEEEVEKFKLLNPPLEVINSTNTWVDYSKLTLPETVLNADQGLKAISNAVDNSIRNIMGKVPWLVNGVGEEYNKRSLSSSPHDKEEVISDSLLKQLEENVAFQKNDVQVTPTSSLSSAAGVEGNKPQLNQDMANSTPFPASNVNSEPTSNDNTQPRVSRGMTQETLRTKLTNSVEGVMKSFKPINRTLSNASLHTADSNISSITNNQSIISTGNNTNTNGNGVNTSKSFTTISPGKMIKAASNNNIRSRTTSFINSSFFGSPTASSNSVNQISHAEGTHQRASSIFGALETAIGSARSRGNSIPSKVTNNSNIQEVDVNENRDNLISEISKLKRFDKKFSDLTVEELSQLYDNYQFIMNGVLNC